MGDKSKAFPDILSFSWRQSEATPEIFCFCYARACVQVFGGFPQFFRMSAVEAGSLLVYLAPEY